MVAPSFWGWGSQRQKPGVASTLGKGSVAQLGGWETEALSQLRSKPLFPPGTHTLRTQVGPWRPRSQKPTHTHIPALAGTDPPLRVTDTPKVGHTDGRKKASRPQTKPNCLPRSPSP